MPGIKVLQILQGYFLGFHFRISLLKVSNKLAYLSYAGTRFQMIGSKYLIELEPELFLKCVYSRYLKLSISTIVICIVLYNK